MSKILNASIDEKDPFIFSNQAKEHLLRHRKQVNDLERELQSKDMFQQIADKLSIILMFSPTFLGVFDVMTDILYVTSQNFADISIYTLFIVFMGFSTLLQFIIWTIFLSVSDIENKNYDTSTHITNYLESLAKSEKFKAYIELTIAYFLTGLYFSYRFALRIPQGLLYAIAGQLKILPFYLTYSFADAGKLQYTITEDFINEYQMKSIQFKKIQHVQHQNESLKKKNLLLRKMNSALQEWDKDKRKSLRELRHEIDLTITDPLTRARIMKNRVYKADRILDNAIFQRFMIIGDLIQAVFESLPMLIIQYINNSLSNSWNSNIARASFAFSFVMTFIHACNMIYKLSQGETFPLIRLLQLIKERDAYESQEWLFGVTKPQTFEIQNENELIIYAQAESKFFENVDRIVFNIQGDQDFINKSECGKSKLFKYLRLLNSKLTKNNSIILDFNDNIALDFNSIQELMQGFKISNAKGYDLKLNNTKIFSTDSCDQKLNLDSSSSLKHLGLDLQGLELGSLQKVDLPRTLESVYFNFGDSTQLEQVFGFLWQGLEMLQKLKVLYLNFENTQIQDLDSLSYSLKSLDLNELELNFDSTQVESLGSLGNSIGTQLNLQKLTLKFQQFI